MTGIRALERVHPTKAMRLGKVELQEFEYIRHGTQSLIANWHVAKGQGKRFLYRSNSLRSMTRANHIANTIETDPQAGWIFIVDQLNTHKSAALVRLVAACCDLDIDLRVKGEYCILQSMATRAAILTCSDSPSSLCLYSQAHLLAQSN